MMMFKVRRGLRFRDGDGKLFTLERIHVSGVLQFCDSDGFVATMYERELWNRWHTNAWVLDTTSLCVLRESAFTATPRDLASFPEDEVVNAEQKFTAIAPFINQVEVSDRELAARIAKLEIERFPKKLSIRSLRRWLTIFKQGRDVVSLTTRAPARRHRGKPYEQLLDQSIEDVFFAKERPTRQQVFDDFQHRVHKFNKDTPAFKRIRLPSRATFFRRLQEIDIVVADRARLGRFEANRKHRTALKHANASFVLERVELDHTLLDIILIDGRTCKALGRPWLTAAIDVYSKMIVGIHLTFEAPSSNSVLQCLKCAILPKDQLLASLGGIQHSWPVAGFFKTVVFDNGLDAHGGRVRYFCEKIGSSVQYCPSRAPWFKGTIERFFRTLNQGFLHCLPGTTFSNPRDRAGYAAETRCQMHRQEFLQLLVRWIVDVYHLRPHSRNGMPPLERWKESARTMSPEFPASPADLELLMARQTERALHHYGIEIDRLVYNSEALQSAYRHLKARTGRKPARALQVRHYDDSVAYIDVLDPLSNNFIRVPAVDTKYTDKLDRHTHGVIRRELNKKFGRAYRMHDRLEALAEIREAVNAAGDKKTRTARAFKRAQTTVGNATSPQAHCEPQPSANANRGVLKRRVPESKLPELRTINASHIRREKAKPEDRT